MRQLDTQGLAAQLAAYMARKAGDEDTVIPVPGMVLFRQLHPTELRPAFYEPVACLILQGQKEAIFGDTSLRVGPGQSLVVSHDVPVLARITEARPTEPYLAMVLPLDVSLLRSLYEEVGDVGGDSASARSAAVHDADPRLINCLARYLELADDPIEARVMAPLVRRELHFRLLMAPHGGMLRALLRHDSHASSITRAIARIRSEFRSSIAVPELAKEIGMSESAFYKHFRAITSNTPVQFQKELRLMEAKRLLAAGGRSVSTVAWRAAPQPNPNPKNSAPKARRPAAQPQPKKLGPEGEAWASSGRMREHPNLPSKTRSQRAVTAPRTNASNSKHPRRRGHRAHQANASGKATAAGRGPRLAEDTG